jgi:catalase
MHVRRLSWATTIVVTVGATVALGACGPQIQPVSSGGPPAPPDRAMVYDFVQTLDAMNKLFGTHPGFRANHAKGIVVEGNFKASPEAASLSKAAIFSGEVLPVTVRFSDSTGIPNVPDGSNLANPHGMAIKFHLPDGSDTDMVINSLKFFPVSDGAGFRDLLLAIAASPPDAPKPTKFEQFVTEHPKVSAAFATATTPDSFADEEYYGIDAFVFVNKAGQRQALRYRMVPERAVHLDSAEAARQPADFLMTELARRLEHGPVTFHLKAQLAEPGDPTSDPAQAWPDSRSVVDLGVLTINWVVADSDKAQKTLLFLPGQLTPGIEQSDDPLIDTRNAAYAVSFSRRNP